MPLCLLLTAPSAWSTLHAPLSWQEGHLHVSWDSADCITSFQGPSPMSTSFSFLVLFHGIALWVPLFPLPVQRQLLCRLPSPASFPFCPSHQTCILSIARLGRRHRLSPHFFTPHPHTSCFSAGPSSEVTPNHLFSIPSPASHPSSGPHPWGLPWIVFRALCGLALACWLFKNIFYLRAFLCLSVVYSNNFWLIPVFVKAVHSKENHSCLDCKEMKSVSPKGNQPWIFIERTDAEAEVPKFWPPNVKSWIIWKIPWFWERLRAKGKKGRRWLDGIIYSRDMSLNTLREIVKDIIG